MASAREIRARLRKKDDDDRRRREDAVVAVGHAAAAAAGARSANDAVLREKVEAALRVPEGDARAPRLREVFEAALADSPSVVRAELAAGRAVLAAEAMRVTRVELAELTEVRVEDLRFWAQMARSEAGAAAAFVASEGQVAAGKPVAGYSVVLPRAGQREEGDSMAGSDASAVAGNR
ncbi:hypothetical protein [Alloactinosynnema sp. L-07]|uniref:hypothetical protein n=1 Tax=Alloactinosynnema sp. L-07 TaxID=1653480 RepID=UPI00065F06E4|nr:hypothetical protein [Alloactinosynnema sp. L-07]CRK56986.1 hypothetical protein [Alloactinosynnema sp. L-07]